MEKKIVIKLKLTFLAAVLNASLWLISGLLALILCISSLQPEWCIYPNGITDVFREKLQCHENAHNDFVDLFFLLEKYVNQLYL